MPRTLRLFTVLVVCMVWAGTVHASEVSSALVRAASLARSGSISAAVRILPKPEAVTIADVEPARRAASAIRKDRPDLALRLALRCAELDPEDRDALWLAGDIWRKHPEVDGFTPAQAARLPGKASLFETNSSTGVPRASIWTIAVNEPVAATDSRSGTPLDRLTLVYVEQNGVMRIRFQIRHDAATDADLAQRMGRIAGLVAEASDRLLKYTNRARYPVAVRLSRSGTAGAEQWANAITFGRVDVPRTPLEWARQMAHEWGHASLAGLTGYTEPEAWTNGDTGERVYLSTLHDWGWLRDWDPSIDAKAYLDSRVLAPVRRWAQTGPVPALVRSRGADGYEHAVGAALYVRAVYGPWILARTLDRMRGNRLEGFLESLKAVLVETPNAVAVRPKDITGPVPICIPTEGLHTLEGRNVRVNGRSVSRPVTLKAGWPRVDWQGEMKIRRMADGSRRVP
ncbi:MAG: hypothetical protein GYA63_09205 [Armatimonadetes bacterium]|jgi:hypothetical protein|nr:hypothetical protein [Armatimonadota bacterium]